MRRKFTETGAMWPAEVLGASQNVTTGEVHDHHRRFHVGCSSRRRVGLIRCVMFALRRLT